MCNKQWILGLALLATSACRDGLLVIDGAPDAAPALPVLCPQPRLVVPDDSDPAVLLGLFANLVVLEVRSIGTSDLTGTRDAAWSVLDRFPSPAREVLEPHVDDVVAAAVAELTPY